MCNPCLTTESQSASKIWTNNTLFEAYTHRRTIFNLKHQQQSSTFQKKEQKYFLKSNLIIILSVERKTHYYLQVNRKHLKCFELIFVEKYNILQNEIIKNKQVS